MTEFTIDNYEFHKECERIASEVWEEYADKFGEDGSEYWHNIFSDMEDCAHETVDGHEWVIYNHKALMICAHCDVNMGEAFLDDIGMPEKPTIYSLASTIVYGEMRARIMEILDGKIKDWEEENE